MYTFLSISFIAILLWTTNSTLSFAQTPINEQGCQPIFGGANSCAQSSDLTVNTRVKNPTTGEYVDNLGMNDPFFGPDQTVPYKIAVKNTTNNTLKNITVNDIFPQYIVFKTGTGSFNTNINTLSFTIDSLNKGEEKVFYIEGKVVSKDTLSPGTVCVINQVTATGNNKQSQDNNLQCLSKDTTVQPQSKSNAVTTKGGLPVYPPTQKTKTAPATGPEVFSLVGLLPLAGIGFYIRRKTK